MTPPADKSNQQGATDLPRSLQAELRRVGCNTGAVDGNWNAASQRSLDLFNKHAGMKLDVKVATVDALDLVKGKTGRICPLVCDHGFKADGDRCAKITCRAGYQVGDDNTCEKIEVKKPVAKREEPSKRERSERAKADQAPAKPQASGQIICTQAGCRPVAKGCRLERPGLGSGQGGRVGMGGYEEVCNEPPKITHSTILSASVRSSIGMVSPSPFAVFWLISRLRIVGNSIGKLAGFSPFRILSTK